MDSGGSGNGLLPGDLERLKSKFFSRVLEELAETWTYTDFAQFIEECSRQTDSKNPFLFLEALIKICPKLEKRFVDLEGLKLQIHELQEQSRVA